ncbi:hypothetical protein HAX54_052098, partial [Datura stramonium]|nr:hypothetical protein [Datura stramonium]
PEEGLDWPLTKISAMDHQVLFHLGTLSLKHNDGEDIFIKARSPNPHLLPGPWYIIEAERGGGRGRVCAPVRGLSQEVSLIINDSLEVAMSGANFKKVVDAATVAETIKI